MFLLILDVFNHRIFVVVRNCKRAVAVLPMRELGENFFLFDPFAGAGLDVLDQIRQRDGRMQAGQDVEVVLDAIDPVKMAVTVINDAPDVAEEVLAVVLLQHGRAVFRGKHAVV